MNTLNNIIEIIKQNDTPYITLLTKEMTKASYAGKFSCETCQADDNKTEKAIEWLINYVKLFPANTHFLISAKSHTTANGSSVIGPISFMVENQQQNVNGLGGTQPTGTMSQTDLAGLGYVHQSAMEAALARKELEHQQQRHQDRFDDIKNQYTQAIENIQATANRWSPESVNNVMSQLINGYAVVTGKSAPQLAGVTTDKNKQEQKNQNPFDTKINTELSEMSNQDKATLLKIINQLKTKPQNEQKRTTTVPADTPSGDATESGDTE